MKLRQIIKATKPGGASAPLWIAFILDRHRFGPGRFWIGPVLVLDRFDFHDRRHFEGSATGPNQLIKR
jgi:hypothetical protein